MSAHFTRPITPPPPPEFAPTAAGMTLRDWFAGQALRELLSFENHPAFYERQAEHAYLVADAMLKAREDAP